MTETIDYATVRLSSDGLRAHDRQNGRLVSQQTRFDGNRPAGGSILVVDDSMLIRRMATQALSGAGYDTLVAIDGADGYATAIANPVRAVVTGLDMPGMNGIEFIRRFRAHPSAAGVPVIFLATEFDEAMMRGARGGAAARIAKPFKEGQLLAVIKKLVGVAKVDSNNLFRQQAC
jgi:two-component system chemotaxis response regulator CheY